MACSCRWNSTSWAKSWILGFIVGNKPRIIFFLALKYIQYGPWARLKISVSTDISVLGFYGYIRYIGEYFYMNINISKINKNNLKFMEILCKSVKITLIIK